MKVDIVIATYNRAHELSHTLRNVLKHESLIDNILVIDNHSTDGTADILSRFTDEKIITVRSDRNLGAAGGKNLGLRRSNADIIVVVDDDAFFNSTDPINKISSFFEENPEVGIIQFKIINFQKDKILDYEFPGKNPLENGDRIFETSYFIGAGHAVRKSMLEKIGYYPDDFFYGHEEIDLSYRALDAGYKIVYFPEVSVLHKKDPSGRLPPRDVSKQLLINRLIMNWRYLPMPIAVVNSLLWLLKTVAATRSLDVALSGIVDFIKRRSNIRRQVVAPATIAYMRRHHGRLFN